MTAWVVYERTIDGATRAVSTCATLEEARAFLRRAAEECRASNHRTVVYDEDALVLVTSYAGDDTVVTFAYPQGVVA